MTTIINASAANGLQQSSDGSGVLELQGNGVTGLKIDSTGAYGQLKQGTAQASTSGTSIDFTGIPSWVKRITVMFNGVSLSGTSNYLIQMGVSGTPVSSGYSSNATRLTTVPGISTSSSSAGFLVTQTSTAADTQVGNIVIANITGNTWICSSSLSNTNSTQISLANGVVALGGVVNLLRITTVNGTDTFDAGSINILYEG